MNDDIVAVRGLGIDPAALGLPSLVPARTPTAAQIPSPQEQARQQLAWSLGLTSTPPAFGTQKPPVLSLPKPGLPGWVLPVGIGALLLGGVVFVMRRKK
jgi:hypothetical protein